MVSAESHVSLPDVAPLSKKPSVVDFHTYPHPCLSHQGKLFSLHKRTTPKGLEYASERGFQGRRKHDTVAHTDHGVRESSTVYSPLVGPRVSQPPHVAYQRCQQLPS